MALPLPAPVQLGGDIVSASQAINALRASDLDNFMKMLQNKYYGPNIESEIANRNALTKGQTITNQYLPDKLRLANAFQQMQNQFYPQITRSEINNRNALTNKYNVMTPLEAQKMKLENQYYPELTQADIANKKAMASWRALGGMQMGVGQKELMGFQHQIQMEHPDWDEQTVNQAASSYLAGDNTLPNGIQLPPLSGIGQTYIAQIQRRNAPTAIQNQAAQMDILYDELKNFNIDAVKEFAGPKGKIRLAEAKLKMATNPNDPTIDPQAREFISSMNQAIINMDAMRKAFGTSVVPDYVYSTLGKLSNPADSIWNDPIQVAKNYQTVLNSIKKTRDMISQKARYGSTYRPSSKSEEKSTAKWIYNQETGRLEPK